MQMKNQVDASTYGWKLAGNAVLQLVIALFASALKLSASQYGISSCHFDLDRGMANKKAINWMMA